MSFEIHTLPVAEFLGLRVEQCGNDVTNQIAKFAEQGAKVTKPTTVIKMLWFNQWLLRRVADLEYVKSYETYEREMVKEFEKALIDESQSNLLL